MGIYTENKLLEALDAINSIIGKCERAHIKFSVGTFRHTLLKNRLNALYISKSLIASELSKED